VRRAARRRPRGGADGGHGPHAGGVRGRLHGQGGGRVRHAAGTRVRRAGVRTRCVAVSLQPPRCAKAAPQPRARPQRGLRAVAPPAAGTRAAARAARCAATQTAARAACAFALTLRPAARRAARACRWRLWIRCSRPRCWTC
jgi:hypothetical protein